MEFMTRQFLRAGLLAIPMMLTLSLHAAVITVDSNNTDPANTVDCTIINAVKAATTQSAIGTCAPGTGTDSIVLPANMTFLFSNGIFGDAASPSALPAVDTDIELIGNGSVLQKSPATCVPDSPPPTYFRWFVVGPSGRLALSGLDLDGGCMLDSRNGGSISVSQGTLELDHVTIRNSYADLNGGAVYAIGGSTVIIRDSNLIGNRAPNEGGALHSEGDILIERSYFGDNSASNGSALYSNFGALSIVNSTFYRNSSDAGAVAAVGLSRIDFSTFSSNPGGAMNHGDLSQISNSIIVSGPGGQPGENCRLSVGTNPPPSPAVQASNFSDDRSCGDALQIDRSGLKMGPIGNYGGNTATIPLLPGSAAIDASASCTGVLGLIVQDQRGQPRPSVALAGCDAGAYEFDSIDHSGPLQKFGAGNVLVSLGNRVTEFTLAGQRIRDIWFPYLSPSDYGMRGVDAESLDAFRVFLGVISPAIGRYGIGTDGWSFEVDPSWGSVDNGRGAIGHWGSHWFVADSATGGSSASGVLVFENGSSIGEIASGFQVSDLYVGKNGIVHVLGPVNGTGSVVRRFNPTTLVEIASFNTLQTAGLTGATAIAADADGNVYLADSSLAPLVKLNDSGQLLAQTDCITSGNPTTPCGGARNIAIADDGMLLLGTTADELIRIASDFTAASHVLLDVGNWGFPSGFYVSPLPADVIFVSSFD
jgi:hypothetical protein